VGEEGVERTMRRHRSQRPLLLPAGSVKRLNRTPTPQSVSPATPTSPPHRPYAAHQQVVVGGRVLLHTLVVVAKPGEAYHVQRHPQRRLVHVDGGGGALGGQAGGELAYWGVRGCGGGGREG